MKPVPPQMKLQYGQWKRQLSLIFWLTTVPPISKFYVQKPYTRGVCYAKYKYCKFDTLAHCLSSNIWSQVYANYVGSVLLTGVAWPSGRFFV
jgi:hypothetical protein